MTEAARQPRHPFLRYFLAAAAGIVVIAWMTVAILASHAGPFLKSRVISDLGERFGGTAELGDFHVSVFPQVRITGEKMTVRRADDAAFPPLITAERFELHASPWGLIRWPMSVGTVHVYGLSITLPPKGDRPKFKSGGKPTQKSWFVIGSVVCDRTKLEILTDKPGKRPLDFEIHSLVLSSAGPGRSMPFSAKLTEPIPLGEIETKGDFGPWETEDPRESPVSGNFSFTHADLGTIKGIGGTLSSQGSYRGKIDRIEVEGKTDTPDFTVATGGHPMPLHTEYSATVDGSDGDTYLHPVRATLLHSVLIANGSVVREEHGRKITLDVVATDARIEDLLNVAVKTSPPALSGPVSLKTSFLLPAGGPGFVPERLILDGTFTLPAAHFSDPSSQNKVDQLSERAQGHPKEAEEQDQTEVFSELHGSFKLKDGVVTLPDLTFKVPGASIRLAGDYRLSDQNFLFRGEARFDAKLSQMTTGVKSFFLKAVDPIFEKRAAGTVLPIRISGTGTKPSVGLDLGHPSRAK